MRFRTFLNELSLQAKEDIYKGSVMTLAKNKEKINTVKASFKYLKIPLNGEFRFLGFNEKMRTNKKNIYDSGSGDKCFIEYNNDIYVIIISGKTFESWWKGSGGKSDTNDRTELKEFVSLTYFDKQVQEKEMINIVKKKKARISDLYRSIYYKSAIQQYTVLKKFGMKQGTHYELQGDTYSSLLYNTAKRLGIKGNLNNWNPGDVWAFSKAGFNILSELGNIKSPLELSQYMKIHFDNRDIVGISLKQIEDGVIPSIEIIDPDKATSTTKDFSLVDIQIPTNESYKSIFFNTKSNISLKGNMRGKATTTCLNIEMYDHNKKNSLGAVDGKIWKTIQQTKNVLSCHNYKESNDEALKDCKKIYKKYSYKIVGDLSFDYKHLDEVSQLRYVILAETLKFIMEQQNIRNFITDKYFLAQKLIKSNPIYLKLS